MIKTLPLLTSSVTKFYGRKVTTISYNRNGRHPVSPVLRGTEVGGLTLAVTFLQVNLIGAN